MLICKILVVFIWNFSVLTFFFQQSFPISHQLHYWKFKNFDISFPLITFIIHCMISHFQALANAVCEDVLVFKLSGVTNIDQLMEELILTETKERKISSRLNSGNLFAVSFFYSIVKFKMKYFKILPKVCHFKLTFHCNFKEI